MSVQVLRAAERLAVPWKNGGGVTRELAAAPAGAGMEAFDWRISIAEVAAGGPFSSFPGVDRVLTVIAGEGLSLAIDGRPAVVLGAASPPLAFSGEARCEAALRAGPIRDLNVMVRRGGWRVEVRRRSLHADEAIACGAGFTLLLALESVGVSWAGGTTRLGPEDAILMGTGARVSVVAPARTIVADLVRNA